MDTPAAPEPKNVNPIEGSDAEKHPHGARLTLSQWFAANATAIMFMAIGIAFIVWKQLDPFDLLKVAIGLGLVIFIHELGHFLAAKWCDVHVETFSIGFGKAIPGCQFKYGETSYKIGWIPLGGYVKMVGEGDNADSDEAEEDPRSFKNKRVGQRMLIISAGVCMNILLAWICFIVVYSHGIEEMPAVIGWVDSGSPAWQAGIHSEAIIDEIDDLKRPMLVFDDIKPIIMGSSKGEKVRFRLRDKPDREPFDVSVEPARDSDALYPVVGVGPAYQLTLKSSRRPGYKPYTPGSPAANAVPTFQSGDKIVATTDPADPGKVTPLPPDEREKAPGKLDLFAYERREEDLRGKKMIVRVQRGDAVQDIAVEPGYYVTTGMRMEMGRVGARRKDSPAEKAKAMSPAGEEDGIQPQKPEGKGSTGDKIIEVEVESGKGKKLRWLAGQDAEAVADGATLKPLDPMRLPYDLEQAWESAQKPANWKVQITVLRPTERKEEKFEQKRVVLEMEWDEKARYQQEILSPNSPLSIPCLGLAYYVESIVEGVVENSPAAEAGIHKSDLIKQVRWSRKDNGKEVKGEWEDIKSYQWAFVFRVLQTREPKEFDLMIERGGALLEKTVKGVPDPSWPMADRGLDFLPDTRLHKADDVISALALGVHRTLRTVRVIYQNLNAMAFGRVSVKTMSGPLTIADVSYKIAGDNIWQFILFIGMINVNLAVINFLPIPVLDGGHMVFLIYEKIRGKPAPESVLAAAMYAGLALILTLMCFVLFLDVKRLWF